MPTSLVYMKEKGKPIKKGLKKVFVCSTTFIPHFSINKQIVSIWDRNLMTKKLTYFHRVFANIVSLSLWSNRLEKSLWVSDRDGCDIGKCCGPGPDRIAAGRGCLFPPELRWGAWIVGSEHCRPEINQTTFSNICGLGIRGLDSSWSRKQVKTANKDGKKAQFLHS